MSVEVANLLLDFVPDLEGEGTVRLSSALSVDLDPDDRATVELARRIGENHFAAVSSDRARVLVDALAAELGLEVHAGRHARLVEDLHPLPGIIEDLDHRISTLPTVGQFRRKIAALAKGRRTRVADLPAGELFRLAEGIERAEQAQARRVPPGPTRVEGTGAAGPEDDTGTAPVRDEGEAA